VSVLDPLGRTTTNAYDALNRLTSIAYSDGVTPNVSYGYDANGNRTSMADGTGSTAYVYDEANRLTSVTSPGSKVVGYRYDLDGNRTKLIYPDATAVTYTFNKASQLSSLQDWAARSVSYAYWPDGLLKTVTNPDGSLGSYAYDNARRLIDVAHTNPGGALFDRSFYTFTPSGNVASVNHGVLPQQIARPDGFVSSNGSWTGTYASINEVTPNDATFLASPSGPASPNYYEVSLSNVLAPMDLTGMKLHYRVSKSGNDSGQQTNLLVELRQGSTVVASVSHTNLPGSSGTGWLDKVITLSAQQASAITDFADLRLRFTPTTTGGGQARKAQISWAELDVPSPADPAQATAYTYDGLSRLVGSSGSNGSMSYGYDPAGNRITATVAGTTTSYAYDRADRMLTAGAAVVSVNMNGNTTNRGSDTFGFDQANRMTAAAVAGATEAYVYDGTGLRFTRQVGAGTPIRYVTDGNRNVPVTIDDGSRKYVYGIGLAFAVSGNVAEIYHADRLGSVRAITTNGGVTATYRADDWGKLTSQTGATTQPYKFAGEPADATGLSYLRARYYDPSLGRFLSRDTIMSAGGSSARLNRYSYVLNNPAQLVDPLGRSSTSVVLGGKRPGNQYQNRQFNNAVTECERQLGITIKNTNKQRQLHDALDEEVTTYQQILSICLGMFGPSTEPEPEPDTAKCTSDANWDASCRLDPFGQPGTVPVLEPAPVPMPGFELPPVTVPIPGFGFVF
jgi:RHS repeat-associated protein